MIATNDSKQQPDATDTNRPRQAEPSAALAQASGRDAMVKARIVDELGEQALLLPVRVNEALAANDRAKYLMTLLQFARAHADHPDSPATDLSPENFWAIGEFYEDFTQVEDDEVVKLLREFAPSEHPAAAAATAPV